MATLEVGSGKEYSTINEAIQAAAEGDTIQVSAGSYDEAVTVNKGVTLVAEGRDVIITNGFGIEADNVTIRGFTFRPTVKNYGSVCTGIHMANGAGKGISNLTVSGNTFDCSSSAYGINMSLNGGANVTGFEISGNEFIGGKDAIYAAGLSGVKITDNTISGASHHGISIGVMDGGNVIENNVISNVSRNGIQVAGNLAEGGSVAIGGNTVENARGSSTDDGAIVIRTEGRGSVTVGGEGKGNVISGESTKTGIYVGAGAADNTIAIVENDIQNAAGAAVKSGVPSITEEFLSAGNNKLPEGGVVITADLSTDTVLVNSLYGSILYEKGQIVTVDGKNYVIGTNAFATFDEAAAKVTAGGVLKLSGSSHASSKSFSVPADFTIESKADAKFTTTGDILLSGGTDWSMNVILDAGAKLVLGTVEEAYTGVFSGSVSTGNNATKGETVQLVNGSLTLEEGQSITLAGDYTTGSGFIIGKLEKGEDNGTVTATVTVKEGASIISKNHFWIGSANGAFETAADQAKRFQLIVDGGVVDASSNSFTLRNTGYLEVRNGGKFTARDGAVRNDVLVTGEGSILEYGGNVYGETGATATMTVTDNATLNITNMTLGGDGVDRPQRKGVLVVSENASVTGNNLTLTGGSEGVRGSVTLTGGSVALAGNLVNNGSVTMDLDSRFAFGGTWSGTGTFDIIGDLDALANGAYRLIDYTGAGAIDYSALGVTLNGEAMTGDFRTVNNDLFLVRGEAETAYVNSKYSALGDNDGRLWGYDAFDSVKTLTSAYTGGFAGKVDIAVVDGVTGDLFSGAAYGYEFNTSAKGQVTDSDKVIDEDALTIRLSGNRSSNGVYFGREFTVYGNVNMTMESGVLSDAFDIALVPGPYASSIAKIYGNTALTIGKLGGADDAVQILATAQNPNNNDAAILGAGSGEVFGDSKVVINSGTIKNNYILGAGSWGYTGYGNSTVEINGGVVESGLIAGGVLSGYADSGTQVGNNRVKGDSAVVITGGKVSGGIQGGSGKATGLVEGNSSVVITGGEVSGTVYGGGGVVEGDSLVSISGGVIDGQVFGGAANGVVKGNTSLKITGGEFTDDVFGGNFVNAATDVLGNVDIEISNAEMSSTWLFGGSRVYKFGSFTSDMTAGKTDIRIGDNVNISDVFGGSWVYHYTSDDAQAASGVKAFVESSNIVIDGASSVVGKVYGGGRTSGNGTGAVSRVGSSTVTVKNGTVDGIFGGGRSNYFHITEIGRNDGSFADEVAATLNVEGGSVGTVYGGGQADIGQTYNDQAGGGRESYVNGSVEINISGGTVGNVYGGGLAWFGGNVNLNDQFKAPVSIVRGDVAINVSGGAVGEDIYAGGKVLNSDPENIVPVAAVEGKATVNLSGGSIGGGVHGLGENGASTLNFNNWGGSIGAGAAAGEVTGVIDGFSDINLAGTVLLLKGETGSISGAGLNVSADSRLSWDVASTLDVERVEVSGEFEVVLDDAAAFVNGAETPIVGGNIAFQSGGKLLVNGSALSDGKGAYILADGLMAGTAVSGGAADYSVVGLAGLTIYTNLTVGGNYVVDSAVDMSKKIWQSGDRLLEVGVDGGSTIESVAGDGRTLELRDASCGSAALGAVADLTLESAAGSTVASLSGVTAGLTLNNVNVTELTSTGRLTLSGSGEVGTLYAGGNIANNAAVGTLGFAADGLTLTVAGEFGTLDVNRTDITITSSSFSVGTLALTNDLSITVGALNNDGGNVVLTLSNLTGAGRITLSGMEGDLYRIAALAEGSSLTVDGLIGSFNAVDGYSFAANGSELLLIKDTVKDLPLFVADPTAAQTAGSYSFTVNAEAKVTGGTAVPEYTVRFYSLTGEDLSSKFTGSGLNWTLKDDTIQHFTYEVVASTDSASNTSVKQTVNVRDYTAPVVRDITVSQADDSFTFTVTIDAADNFGLGGGFVKYTVGGIERDAKLSADGRTATIVLTDEEAKANDFLISGTVSDASGNTVDWNRNVTISHAIDFGTHTIAQTGALADKRDTDSYLISHGISGTTTLTVNGLEKGEKVRVTFIGADGKKKSATLTWKKNSVDGILTAAGTAMVTVEALSKNGVGDYTLESKTDYFCCSKFNSFAEACETDCISKTAQMNDWVGYGDAWDYHRISADTAGHYTVKVSAAEAKVKVYFLDSCGKRLKSMTVGAGREKSFELDIMAGTSYVQVVSADNGKGKHNTGYTLEVTGDMYDKAGMNPDVVDLGLVTDTMTCDVGWVGFSDRQDVFRFTTDGGMLDLDLSGTGLETYDPKHLKLTVRNESGRKIALDRNYDSKKEIAAGTYMVTVEITNEKKYESDYQLGIAVR
ncbi:MAG: hypothetical protein HPZ91_12565 [Lentisphaeria bacterium]|nr:hypothetical protein [Lentisphaeria bacterium]